ncbi:unnamed protein product [Owenia fusiformis]|uniref:Uncharacterized protein n=1 Tax=Owenia fusiformis TaxID=6347 RepID=A0A8S4N196_OWEFU|nr:unnamed protein product [Owenia fusiformis]
MMWITVILLLHLYDVTYGNPCNATCQCTSTVATCLNNSLTAVPNNLPMNLSSLEINYNNITELTKSPNMPSGLLLLDLSFNNIESIAYNTFRPVKSLEMVILSHNEIKIIEDRTFYPLRKLTILDLSYNHLVELKSNIFANSKYVTRLEVSNNEISKIGKTTFKKLRKLIELNLSHNPLAILDFHIPLKLGLFNCSHCKLSQLPREVNYLPKGITKLDFSHNRFTTFPAKVIQRFTNISLINIIYNTFQCDERIMELKEIIQKRSTLFIGPMYCTGPSGWNGTTLRRYSPNRQTGDNELTTKSWMRMKRFNETTTIEQSTSFIEEELQTESDITQPNTNAFDGTTPTIQTYSMTRTTTIGSKPIHVLYTTYHTIEEKITKETANTRPKVKPSDMTTSAISTTAVTAMKTTVNRDRVGNTDVPATHVTFNDHSPVSPYRDDSTTSQIRVSTKGVEEHGFEESSGEMELTTGIFIPVITESAEDVITENVNVSESYFNTVRTTKQVDTIPTDTAMDAIDVEENATGVSIESDFGISERNDNFLELLGIVVAITVAICICVIVIASCFSYCLCMRRHQGKAILEQNPDNVMYVIPWNESLDSIITRSVYLRSKALDSGTNEDPTIGTLV